MPSSFAWANAETARYYDDGCEVAPRCLECPLVRCRYEASNSRSIRIEQRNRAIIETWRLGAPAKALADHFGISCRTVWRVARAANA